MFSLFFTVKSGFFHSQFLIGGSFYFPKQFGRFFLVYIPMVWLPLNACFICFVLFAFLNDVNSQSGQTEINSVEDIKCCRKLNSDFVTGFNSLLYNAKPIVFRQPEIKGENHF